MDVFGYNMTHLNNAGFKSDGSVFREIYPFFEGNSSAEESKNTFLQSNISRNFSPISEFIEKFSVSCFHSKEKIAEYVSYFKLDEVCRSQEVDKKLSQNIRMERTVSPFEEKPFEAEYDDLVRLHYLVLKRKALTTLEFGSGYSTAILAHAKQILASHFEEWAIRNIRVEHPFHVYAIEEEQRFLEITQSRLGELSNYASVSRSSVDMILYDNRIASVYSKLPNVSPDFIYLDGPSQFATNAEINGFSFANKCRMPMSADILRFEFFLEPGTLILVDGRTANARFLKAYLRRNWLYEHDPIGDIHYFELDEPPLGKFNQVKLEFCLDEKWLLK